jgi:hypothetical protein
MPTSGMPLQLTAGLRTHSAWEAVWCSNSLRRDQLITPYPPFQPSHHGSAGSGGAAADLWLAGRYLRTVHAIIRLAHPELCAALALQQQNDQTIVPTGVGMLPALMCL